MRSLLLVAVAALVLAPAALAKELSQMTVCGAEGCRTTTDRDELRAITNVGDETLPPPAAGAFYTVELSVDGAEADSWTIWYAPGPNAIAVVNEHRNVVWHSVGTAAAGAVYRRATRGLEPFPAPRVTSVRVGDRVVTEGAQSYLRLFAQPGGERGVEPTLTDWVRVDLRSARPTPWTASTTEFMFSADGRALERGWELVALPEATADAIAAGEPLGVATDGRRLLPWLLLAALAAGLLFFAALGRVFRASAPAAEPA